MRYYKRNNMANDNLTNAPSGLVPHRKASDEEVSQAMTSGIVFKGAKLKGPAVSAGVKTKAKKKGYVTGSHGSGAARKKADIRTRRANRHKK